MNAKEVEGENILFKNRHIHSLVIDACDVDFIMIHHVQSKHISIDSNLVDGTMKIYNNCMKQVALHANIIDNKGSDKEAGLALQV